MLDKEYFLQELKQIKEVPTLPQVAFKLIVLISENNSSVREIARLIEDDPPLVAKILRLVNSGYYSLRNEVKNIRQAVVLIGLEELRNLLFALSVFSTFYHIKENEHFSFLKFWKHSAATGKVAAVLSKYLDLNLTHTVFIGGLLHDFGRLVLQLYFQEEYLQAFHYSVEHHIPLYQAEREALNFAHDEAGYWLAKQWNLPEDLALIIRDHHRVIPEWVKENTAIALVHAGNRITNIWGVGIEPLPVMELLEDDPVWQEMLKVFPKLEKFPLEEMTRVFDMQLEEAEIFVDRISELHHQEESG